MLKLLVNFIFVMLAVLICGLPVWAGGDFVSARDGQLWLDGRPYIFVGTNYWYGSFLGLEPNRKRGIERLRRELDFLKANGVTNLRLMAGAEGSGPMNGVTRVGPSLQPGQGRFDARSLNGLDLLLDEMSKRDMKAVIFLSNNWEWSGGFEQYLIWNKVIPRTWLTKKPDWDELRDIVAKFYSCEPCKAGYLRQARFVIGHRNRYNGLTYAADPTIMAWELANEPRPMRPAANDAYIGWISEAAAAIKARDRLHLVTIGHEGWIGTESPELYEQINADKNIDYLTIHIWPKNWGWLDAGLAPGFSGAVDRSLDYARENIAIANKLRKPLVIEEFGLPRDGGSLDSGSSTIFRDMYYAYILGYIGSCHGCVAGANFWAFGGLARPIKGQAFWKPGDERMGDPPMEEQGLNSVFDTDALTWKVIRAATQRFAHAGQKAPTR